MTFTLDSPQTFPKILAEIQPEMGRLSRSNYCPRHFEYEVQPTKEYILMTAAIYLADGDYWEIFEIKFSKFLTKDQVSKLGEMFDDLSFGISGYFKHQHDGQFRADIEQYLLRW